MNLIIFGAERTDTMRAAGRCLSSRILFKRRTSGTSGTKWIRTLRAPLCECCLDCRVDRGRLSGMGEVDVEGGP